MDPSQSWQNTLSQDPRYRCCCGSMIITSGAIVVAVIQAFAVGASGILTILGYSTIDPIYTYIGAGINAVPIILVFIGVTQKKRIFLIPNIVLLIINILCLFGLFIFIAITAIQLDDPDVNQSALYMTDAIYALAISIQLRFLWVMIRCFAYLKALENPVQVHSVTYTVQNASAPPMYTA